MAGDKAICLDSIVIQKELRFSSLFEKPEIIILDDDTIVGNIDKLLAKDSLLLILDKELNALHVFDRSGEFKYNIGSQGVVRESIRCCVILPLIRKGMSMP